IVSDWEQEESEFNLSVTIPVNTIANVYVPADSKWAVTEGEEFAHEENSVTFIDMEDGYAVYEVGSGSYTFSAEKMNASALKELVEHFEKEGDIEKESTARLLKTHLTSVSHYEDKEE